MTVKSQRKPLRMGARRRGDPLPTLGDLRKGAPKGAQGVGRELKDFRLCNFDEGDAGLMEFVQAVGKLVTPKDAKTGDPLPPYYTANRLPFVFHEPTVAGNLMIFNECYRGKVLIHRCMPDESRVIIRALDPVTLKPVIVDGHDVKTGEVVRCDDKPIYTYTNNKQEEVEVGCSPVVRLKVMLRGQGKIGTWDVLSTSAIDGEHLQHQLETFYNAFASSPIPVLRENGLRGIPFILHRMPEVEVPYYDANDSRKTSKHSFISIEIDPSFGALYMESTVRGALNAVDAPKQLKAGQPLDEDEADDEILDAAVGGTEPAAVVIVQPTPKPAAPAVTSPAVKPAAPATVVAASDKMVTLWNGDQKPDNAKIDGTARDWFAATYVGKGKTWDAFALYGGKRNGPDGNPIENRGHCLVHFNKHSLADFTYAEFVALVDYTRLKAKETTDLSVLNPVYYADKIAEIAKRTAKQPAPVESAEEPDPMIAAAQQLGAVVAPVDDLASKIIAQVKNLSIADLDVVVASYYNLPDVAGQPVDQFLPGLTTAVLDDLDALLTAVANGLVDPTADAMLDTLRLGEINA